MGRWFSVLLLGCASAATAAAQPSTFDEDYAIPATLWPTTRGKEYVISGLADETLCAEYYLASNRYIAELAKRQAALDARYAGCAGAVPSLLGFIREGAGMDFDGSLGEQAAEYVRRNGSRCPAAESMVWLPGRVECTDCLGRSGMGRRPADCYLELAASPMEKPGPDLGPTFKEPTPRVFHMMPGFFP